MKGYTISQKKYGIAVYFKSQDCFIHFENRYFDSILSAIQSFNDLKKNYGYAFIFHNNGYKHPNYCLAKWKIDI